MATEAWEDAFTLSLASAASVFPNASPDAAPSFARFHGQDFLIAERSIVPALVRHLRDSEGFDYFCDLTVVDRPKEARRFEVVVILYSMKSNRRLRIKSHVGDDEGFPTLTHLYAGANWLEREAYDMFGVRFAGHPNLKRILMPDDWQGHPLRKEKSIVDMDNEWVQKHLGIESGQ